MRPGNTSELTRRSFNTKINLLLGTFEELNGKLAKDNLELFHYYNELMNGFQGVFLEFLKNYTYLGVKVVREKGMERDLSEKLQTLNEIIKTELPREEHAMNKVNAFKKQKGDDVEGWKGGEGSMDRSGNVGRETAKGKEMVTDSWEAKGATDKRKKSEVSGPKDKKQSKAEVVGSGLVQGVFNPQMSPEDTLLRTSVSKAINASQNPVKFSLPLKPEPEGVVPSYRIDPKTEKAVEINGDEGIGVIQGHRFNSSFHSDQTDDPLANANLKQLSLKALNEYIDDFLAKKRQHDEQSDSQTSRTTPEDFLLLHLKKKYGLPDLVMQNALAIVESAKQLNGQDYKASLFNHVSSTAVKK